MDASHFDRFARVASTMLSRRGVASALGLGVFAFPTLADAKKKRKKRKKKKKVTFNDFGCVNVGNFCKNSDQCCSGICQGKKGKKICKAHDAEGCQVGQQASACGGVTVFCTTSAGLDGFCDTTTGNAGYCRFDGDCFPCSKDADCVEICGPAAACILCADVCSGTGDTACVGPETCTFPLPEK